MCMRNLVGPHPSTDNFHCNTINGHKKSIVNSKWNIYRDFTAFGASSHNASARSRLN